MNTLSFAAALIAIILPSHLVRSDGSISKSSPLLPQMYILQISFMLYKTFKLANEVLKRKLRKLTIRRHAYYHQRPVLVISRILVCVT